MKINFKNQLIDLIENILNHKMFRPSIISIITSFVLFNGFSYLDNYLANRVFVNEKYSKIKINIPDSYYGFNISNDQVLEYEVKNGDTLSEILINLGADEADVFNILTEIKKVFDPKLINYGNKLLIKHQVQISYKDNKEDNQRKISQDKSNRKVFVQSISFNPSAEIEIKMVVNKNANGEYSYQAKKIQKVLNKQIVKYSATIKNGLYVDGTDVGISPNTMINMINLYGFDVDFQRDIREGDQFEILFESYYDEDGKRVKDGDVLFASLNLQQKRTIDIYLNKDGGKNEYFDAKGNSVRKSLLRTPINGARISSGFGARRHPVLGYTKMHKGIDFAAPSGTPIFAAGSGKITYYGRKGGYGNFVQISHNNNYSTAYAHASRFVKRLRVGSKVKQGDVIAYVGSTGRSTGPHLHYEIIFKGKPINPSKVKSVSGLKLSGKKLKQFMINKNQIDHYLKNTPNQNKY